MRTEVVRLDGNIAELGHFSQGKEDGDGCSRSRSNGGGGDLLRLNNWVLLDSPARPPHPAAAQIRRAAEYLRTGDTPVGFPTETVYGLGADATRSAAVKGIYAAKGRPSDNPLIVHVCDLDMLRGLLRASSGSTRSANGVSTNGDDSGSGDAADDDDPIPSIYRPLLEQFWPGPLTILLHNPAGSALAPEVTAGLPTFGARMPDSPLALSLIKLAGCPLAAPSANASTRPSPTTASHVLEDLDGRLELILDGGACAVGVESTVVDGLCDPPAVLRPGGISIEELRRCPGWEGVQKAYKDAAELGVKGPAAPRAPGMKYKHYSPRAKVVLFEAGFPNSLSEDLAQGRLFGGGAEADGQQQAAIPAAATVGIIRTRRRGVVGSFQLTSGAEEVTQERGGAGYPISSYDLLPRAQDTQNGADALRPPHTIKVQDIDLGHDVKAVAQGLFSALRELDTRGVDLICVEGVGDGDDLAAAVMNRLRKAASEIRW